MKSTGEVLGIAKTFGEALLKGLTAAGYQIGKKQGGNILITVKDSDQLEMLEVAEKFEKLGFTIYATPGCALMLNRHMIAANVVRKMDADHPHVMDLVESGKLDYILSTSAKGRLPIRHSVQMRRKAVELSIPCLTSLDTANALASVLKMQKSMDDVELVDLIQIG